MPIMRSPLAAFPGTFAAGSPLRSGVSKVRATAAHVLT